MLEFSIIIYKLLKIYGGKTNMKKLSAILLVLVYVAAINADSCTRYVLCEPAICVDEKLTVENGAIIDMLCEPLECHVMGIHANSAAEGAINLGNSAVVNCDVTVVGDPNIIINAKQGAVISGNIYGYTDSPDFPPVFPPSPLSPYSIAYKSGTQLIQITDAHFVTDSIDIPTGCVLEVSGNSIIYVTSDINLYNGAQLIVPEGSSLSLFLGGNLTAKNNSVIDGGITSTSFLHIYGLNNSTSIRLGQDGSYRCAGIYAPNTDIELQGEFTGLSCSRSLTMKPGSKFIIYDCDPLCAYHHE